MIRFLFKLILCVLLAVAGSFAYLAVRSGDPTYTFYEWISPARFQQYDRLIKSVAAEQQLDPMLVKAVVWRESRFDPQKYGTAGERGLMQVSEKAAEECKKAIALDPDHSYPYGNLAWCYVNRDRLAEAQTTLQRASKRKLEIPEFLIVRYQIAFLKGDKAGPAVRTN